MKPTSSRALRAAAWIALASAAAAAPGLAAAADMYLKLGSIKGEKAATGSAGGGGSGGQIAIESFSWGEQMMSNIMKSDSDPAGRVSKIDSFTIKQTVRSDDVGEARVAAADLDGDGRPDEAKTHDKATPKLAEARAAAGNEGVGGAAAEASAKVSMQDISAPSMTSGKRQHGWVTVSKPLERGSLSVRGGFPGCRVGDTYADAVLQTATMRFELKEVFITNCPVSPSGGGGGSGGALPTESISLNYAKIRLVTLPAQDPKADKVQVRGWDPEKKQP